MSDHFAAFSFVDRIIEFEAGKRAVGRYHVPVHVAAFPSCLVAEAVGQLAAWTAMAHIGFRGRPVAALATETRFHGDVGPGDALALSVDIDSCDDEAVAYSGKAEARGKTVVELIHCLGPMLPVEEFDAPEAMAARLEVIRGPGAKPGAFRCRAAPDRSPRRGAGTLGERHAPRSRKRAVFRRPLSAATCLPGDAVAGRANRSRDERRT